ncbi:MAG: hydroxymethylbilane synthase [Crocinitomicaceae bacterium]
MSEIVIGSRGSDLALWQAHHVKDKLTELGHNVTINIIKTQGDMIQHLSFDKLEGKGFFTKEIEAALLDGSVDLAVHSHKDLETNPPEDLIIGAVSNRANPADLLLIRKTSTDSSRKWNLKEGAIVGTSSARRKSQMLAYRSDVKLKDLRGNVPTRINKLREEQYDAILLAKAGVDRLELDLSEFEVVVLDPTEFVPAPAQGVLGLQIRKNDDRMAEILMHLNDKEVQRRISFERKVLNLMEGGCQLPLGVYCDENNTLFASYAPIAEGNRVYKTYKISEDTDVVEMASKVVNELQQHVTAE